MTYTSEDNHAGDLAGLSVSELAIYDHCRECGQTHPQALANATEARALAASFA